MGISIQTKASFHCLLMVIVGVRFYSTILKERSNANKMSKAMTAMYQDRLMVEGYIFRHFTGFFRKSENIYQESPAETPHFLNQKLNTSNRIQLFQINPNWTVAEEQTSPPFGRADVEKIKQASSGSLSLVSEMEEYIMLPSY